MPLDAEELAAKLEDAFTRPKFTSAVSDFANTHCHEFAVLETVADATAVEHPLKWHELYRRVTASSRLGLSILMALASVPSASAVTEHTTRVTRAPTFSLVRTAVRYSAHITPVSEILLVLRMRREYTALVESNLEAFLVAEGVPMEEVAVLAKSDGWNAAALCVDYIVASTE